MTRAKRDAKPETPADASDAAGASDEKARPARRRNFYAGVARNREALVAAMSIDGIDDEIALLRAELREAMSETHTHEMMFEGIALLVKAVAQKYRMSPKNAEDFAEHALRVLSDFSERVGIGAAQEVDDV